MAEGIEDADPDRMARCPRRLLGDGPRCAALVLVRDADTHGRWHDALDDALQAPVEAQLNVAEWPADPAGPLEYVAGPAADDAGPLPGR